MKLKKIVALMGGLSIFLAVSTPAVAGGGHEEGPSPKLSKAEEAGLVIAETLLSITAGLISSGNGCGGVPGGPFSINVGTDGSGTATYGSSISPISLAVMPIPTPEELTGFGQKYDVAQEGVGYLDEVNSIQNYKGTLSYSDGGAILISDSVFEMLEFTEYVMWDEHNIKDFWLNDETGRHIADVGLEVITKKTYPISKWRQTSEHWRWNGSNGSFKAEKYLMTPYNSSECTIKLSTTVLKQSLGRFITSGNIEVIGFSY